MDYFREKGNNGLYPRSPGCCVFFSSPLQVLTLVWTSFILARQKRVPSSLLRASPVCPMVLPNTMSLGLKRPDKTVDICLNVAGTTRVWWRIMQVIDCNCDLFYMFEGLPKNEHDDWSSITVIKLLGDPKSQRNGLPKDAQHDPALQPFPMDGIFPTRWGGFPC